MENITPNNKSLPQILIVDDEPDLVRIYADSLRHAGYAVLAASDGPTALALARAYPPDVILLDVRLPGPSGLELLPAFLKLDPDVFIVMLSILDEADVAVAAMNGGAYTYLTKGLPLPKVLATVTEAWQARQSRTYRCYDDLCVDLRAQRALIGNESVVLTPYEWSVLASLARQSAGMTYASLWETVWDNAGDIDKDLLQRMVSNLRQKVGADHIETVRGWGYRLV